MSTGRNSSDDDLPIGCTVFALMIVVAFIGWSCNVGVYAHNIEGWYPEYGRVSILWIGFAQIPNVFSVISYVFETRIWIPALIATGEVLVFLAGKGMQRVEKNLQKRPGKRR